MTLDPEVLDQLRWLSGQTGRDLTGALIDLFHRETPQRLRRMRSALERGDTETLAEEAHRLKGGVANVGAIRMGRLCGRLEDEARDASLARARQLLVDIEQEYERVGKVLGASFESG